MPSAELENLVKIGKLKREPPTPREMQGLLASGRARLADARNETLSYDSRFDLVYNAAHAFALLALRRLGYRSENRYLVFQALPHTLGMPPEVWRVLDKAHGRRNVAEYEGQLEHDVPLLANLLSATSRLQDAIDGLPSDHHEA